MARWRNPQARTAARIVRTERDLLSVPGNGVGVHGITRQEPLRCSASQIPYPQLSTIGLAVGHQVVEIVSFGVESRISRISFRGNLVVAVLLVEPHGAVLRTDGGDERFAVRSRGDARLRGRAGSH